MPEAPLQKDFFQLNGGINTESNEISFPDGFTVDESNYELLVDGSRRRRKGLDQESGGSTKTLINSGSLDSVERCQAYLWSNVGGDSSVNFWAHKIDNSIMFHSDDDTPSTTWRNDGINLAPLALGGATTSQEPTDFAQLNGKLYFANPGHKPIRVTYQPGTNDFDIEELSIRIRDYKTQDDGQPLNYHPPSAGTPAALSDPDLTDDHWYNLANRGWKASDLLAYADGESEWPSLVQAWYRGYRRQVNASYADLDGIKIFDSAKLAAEDVGLSSAPLGALFVDVFDDTVGVSDSALDISNLLSDTTPTLSTAADPWTVTLDETGHAWSPTDVVPIAFYSLIEYAKTGGGFGYIYIGPTVTVTATTANTWTYEVDEPADWDGVSVPTVTVHWWYVTRTLTRNSGTGPLDVGPTSIEGHDGRLFYAGIPDPTWANHVFFSQLVDEDDKAIKCYVEADPTDPNINQIQETDGGYIIIPDVGNVKKMLSTRNALLVFSDRGVWEISGNQGFFSPLNYRVRKITDEECVSATSPVLVGNNAMYASSNGVYAVAPNQYTGLLEATNILEDTILTMYNRIGDFYKTHIQMVYDTEVRKLYLLHGGDGNVQSTTTTYIDPSTSVGKERRLFSTMLILDLRLNAWYKYEFESAAAQGILTAYAMRNQNSTNSADGRTRFKVLVQQSATTVDICDFNHTDYVDFNGSESPLPFMLTGWDNIGDFQRRRQAPVVTVFAKRTETGYTSTGNGFDPVNESSNLLTAYWDWTDDAVSGKIGSQQETYRKPRNFVPSGTSDVDGYPVVVSRNKVRGRGRVLQLRFDGAATKDSHLLGFSVNYKVSRAV